MSRTRAAIAAALGALLASGMPAVPAATAAERATTVVPTTVRLAPAASPSYAVSPPTGITCRTVGLTLSCVIGRSVQGRAIVAVRQGDPVSARVLVVSGQMHGEEWPGPRVVDAIRATSIPVTAAYQVWTVRTINPDGARLGRRYTSHRVDLNRNFPDKFVRMANSGPRALSEPESRAMARFLTWVQPDLVISLHGFSTSVDTTGGGRRAAWARSFSALTRITPAVPVPCGGPCHGNMTDWYTATSTARGVAFTVELPRSSLSAHRCAVPGRPSSVSTIRCAAWASLELARRLPA